MELPRSLTCLTLEYVIADRDTVEQYLALDPETTEYCIPIAVRNLLKPYAEKSGMPNTMLTKDMLWRCLEVLWQNRDINRYELMGHYGATYILPYIMTHELPPEPIGEFAGTIGEMLKIAAANDHLTFIYYTLKLYPELRNDRLIFVDMMESGANAGYPRIVLFTLELGALISGAFKMFPGTTEGVIEIYEEDEPYKHYARAGLRDEVGDLLDYSTGTSLATSLGSKKDYQDVINILNYAANHGRVPCHMIANGKAICDLAQSTYSE